MQTRLAARPGALPSPVRLAPVRELGADEVVAVPAYLRDVVTIGRLFRGVPRAKRGHLVGSLAETTGMFTLVRALEAGRVGCPLSAADLAFLAMDLEHLGRPDLAADPGLASNAGRDVRADELYAAIGAWVEARDGDTVLAAMEAAEVPASPVYSVADMFRDAQFAARGMFEAATLPDGQRVCIPGIVPKLAGTPGSTEWLGPKLGEHTDEILASLDFTVQEIAALREKGAI